MPLFYDTAGIPIQLATPQVNYGALANVRPLSFGQNPIQIGASAQWVVPEPKPYIAQGIGQAAQGIAHGMDVAAQAKREEARQRAANELEGKKEEAAATKEGERRTFEAEQNRLNRNKDLLIARFREVGTDKAGKNFQSLFDDTSSIDSAKKADLTKDLEAEYNELTAPSAFKGGALSSVPKVVSATPGVNFKSLFDYLNQPAPSTSVTSPTIPWEVPASIVPLKAKATAPTEPLLPEQPAVQPTEGRTLSSLIPSSTQASELKKEVFANKYSAGEMPRLPSVAIAPLEKGGTLRSVQEAELWAKEFNRGGGDPNWRAEGIVPDGQGGVQIKYVNVAEERKKAEEAHAKRSKDEQIKIERARNTEGKSVTGALPMKNFEGPNGLRPMTRSFLSAYNTAKEYPSNAGVSDIEMINSYIRATSGGKVTENEIKSLTQAASWADKFSVRLSKPRKGSVLSDDQRDQMLRTILENHNSAANGANEVLMTARDRLLAAGENAEIHLPHPYVNDLILKSDAQNKIKNNKVKYDKLLELKKSFIRDKNDGKVSKTEAQMRKIAEANKSYLERLESEEYSDSDILGIDDFHTKRQGYVAGGGSAGDSNYDRQDQQN